VRLRELDSTTARAQAVVAFVLCVGLPAGSLLHGNAIFAWNMFSKSETYRLRVVGTSPTGTFEIDPRTLGARVGPSIAPFLPAPGEWRHEPVGLTLRSSLASIALAACPRVRPGEIDVTLDERADLDATPRTSTMRAMCR
jgi:hypothetical protein